MLLLLRRVCCKCCKSQNSLGWPRKGTGVFQSHSKKQGEKESFLTSLVPSDGKSRHIRSEPQQFLKALRMYTFINTIGFFFFFFYIFKGNCELISSVLIKSEAPAGSNSFAVILSSHWRSIYHVLFLEQFCDVAFCLYTLGDPQLSNFSLPLAPSLQAVQNLPQSFIVLSRLTFPIF